MIVLLARPLRAQLLIAQPYSLCRRWQATELPLEPGLTTHEPHAIGGCASGYRADATALAERIVVAARGAAHRITLAQGTPPRQVVGNNKRAVAKKAEVANASS